MTRLSHPRRNINRHSAPPGTLTPEHITPHQTRKSCDNQSLKSVNKSSADSQSLKSVNKSALKSATDTAHIQHEPPAAVRRSTSDRFQCDKKGIYGDRLKGHFINSKKKSCQKYLAKMLAKNCLNCSKRGSYGNCWQIYDF